MTTGSGTGFPVLRGKGGKSAEKGFLLCLVLSQFWLVLFHATQLFWSCTHEQKGAKKIVGAHFYSSLASSMDDVRSSENDVSSSESDVSSSESDVFSSEDDVCSLEGDIHGLDVETQSS